MYRIWKKEHAKLQWKFLPSQRSLNRVLNVECRYRAFRQDDLFIIVPTESINLFEVGYRPVHVRVDEQPSNPCEVINILQHLPSADIVPKGFVTDAYQNLVRVMKAVTSYFKSQPTVVSQWTEFVQQFPKNDSVVDYVSANQLHVPFQEELFGGLCDVCLTGNIDSVDIKKRNFFNGKPIERVRTGNSAKHSSNLQPEDPFIPYSNIYSIDKDAERDAFIDGLVDINVNEVSKKDLTTACQTAGLKLTGNKTELIDRLRKYYQAKNLA